MGEIARKEMTAANKGVGRPAGPVVAAAEDPAQGNPLAEKCRRTVDTPGHLHSQAGRDSWSFVGSQRPRLFQYFARGQGAREPLT